MHIYYDVLCYEDYDDEYLTGQQRYSSVCKTLVGMHIYIHL